MVAEYLIDMNTLIVIIMSKKHDLFFRDGRDGRDGCDDCDGIIRTTIFFGVLIQVKALYSWDLVPTTEPDPHDYLSL